MQQLQAALIEDDLLQSLAFARAENRRYKVLIHQKVKDGLVLDDDEKKVSHTFFHVIYFVPPNILHLLYSFHMYVSTM